MVRHALASGSPVGRITDAWIIGFDLLIGSWTDRPHKLRAATVADARAIAQVNAEGARAGSGRVHRPRAARGLRATCGRVGAIPNQGASHALGTRRDLRGGGRRLRIRWSKHRR
jgi:hypothetical protein